MKDHIALAQAEVQERLRSVLVQDEDRRLLRPLAANVSRVWTPSSEAATDMIEGLPQYLGKPFSS
jgi:hypothetical protein